MMTRKEGEGGKKKKKGDGLEYMRWKKQKCLKLKPTIIMSCSTFWNNDQHAAQSLHISVLPGN